MKPEDKIHELIGKCGITDVDAEHGTVVISLWQYWKMNAVIKAAKAFINLGIHRHWEGATTTIINPDLTKRLEETLEKLENK